MKKSAGQKRNIPDGTVNESAVQLLKRNHELAILNAIAGALNRSLDVEEGLQETLRLVSEMLGLHSGWVWLLDESGEPYVASAQDLPPYLLDPAHPERMTGTCYCLDTFSTGDLKSATNINTITCSRLTKAWQVPHDAVATQGLRFHASIPLYAGTKRLGVLNVASTDWRQLDADELQFLYTIGYQLGLAIERARLSQQATMTAARLATMEERNRLAREIHDTLMQNLAGISFYLESTEKVLPLVSGKMSKLEGVTENELRTSVTRREIPTNTTSEGSTGDPALNRMSEGIRRASELTRLAMQEARRSVANLRVAPVEESTLVQALSRLVKSYGQATGIETHFRVPAGAAFLTALSPAIEDSLYRIAQEALNNIQRHAEASEIELKLIYTQNEKELALFINDNGKGFDTTYLDRCEELACSGHFGLLGMNERARLLEGRLAITSTPGKGTQLEVRIPL